jgi:SAM-dependent methyltransferase
MAERVNLYDNVYGDFGGAAEAAVRQETYGEDIGQSSWMTVGEWRRFADHVRVRPESHVLEVGSGSGGPAVYLAATTRCRITGVDINESGVQNGERLASRYQVAGRATFKRVDASQPLPFPDASFNAVISNDAICHLPNRLDVLRDWHRLVDRRGRILFTDALVVTGPLSHEEIATRSSIGFYVFVPPGENERLIELAGFRLVLTEDLTEDAAVIAERWHRARQRHRDALVEREGHANFDGLQRFLACVQRVSAERRLSRFAYVAEKPA